MRTPRLIDEELMTVDKANQMLCSWTGHARYANSRNFIQSILNRRSYIQYDGNKLTINEEALKCYIEKMKNSN